MTGRLPQRGGNRHPFVAPYDCYRAKDGDVVIGVGNSALFRALMTAIGREELGRDPRYKSPPARLERHDEVNRIVADWVAERTVDEVMQVVGPDGANVPCAPVMTVDRLSKDPQILARKMLIDMPHAKLGQIPVSGVPFKLSESSDEIERLGPELGEHNAEIYGGMLGYTETELEQLRAEGVI
jgi:crotonobetainyl-CoA:carnitine CoA-transferase CaiB-like acyl-CoA transferase